MKNKGFTLIELLAVILILGVIALIAVPIVTNIVNDAKISAAKLGAYKYINELEKNISMNLLKGNTFTDGIYNIYLFDIELKGKKPLNSSCILINDSIIKKYVIHYEDYTVKYDDDIVTVTGYNESITCDGTYIYNPVNTLQSQYSSIDNTFYDPKYRNMIKTISFNLSDIIPANSLISWDVSKDKDGSVVAYIMLRDDGYYDLYIGSDGGVLANKNSGYLFADFALLESIDFKNFDTHNVELMSSMFNNDENLTNINFTNFNTSNVTSFGHMFYNCKKLKKLNLTGFDISKAQYLDYMFANCYILEADGLNLENWDTSNVINMSYLFGDCRALTTFNLSKWNTSNVTNMSGMFWACNSAKNYNLSSFDTSKVTSMERMFGWNNNALTNLDLSSFDTSLTTNTSLMFFRTPLLQKITTSNKFVIPTNNTDMFTYSGVDHLN